MSESRSPSHDETLILPDIAVMGGPNPFPDDFPDREWMWEYVQEAEAESIALREEDLRKEQLEKESPHAKECAQRNLLKAKAEAWRLAREAEGDPDNDDPDDYDQRNEEDPKNPLFWGKYGSEAGLDNSQPRPDLNYPDIDSDKDFPAQKWGDDFDDRLNSGWEPWNDPNERDDDDPPEDYLTAQRIRKQMSRAQTELWENVRYELREGKRYTPRFL